MGFNIDAEGLLKGLADYESNVDKGARMYAEQAAAMLQREAKQNAPWQDQTGRARQSLNSYVSKYKDSLRINLAHGVDYGIFLELAHGKNFAILEPTIRLKSDEILEGFARYVNKVNK